MKERISYYVWYHTATSIQNTHTKKKKHFRRRRSRQNKTKKKERKISVYGTEEEDPEGETVEDGGRTMAEQIKASVSKGVDKVKLM
jgi:hypothetical protein